MLFKLPQAISKFESLVNQIQKNAKDINSRLEMIENTTLFKQPSPKIGGMLPDAKVCQVLHTVLTLLLRTLSTDDDDGIENVAKKMNLLFFKLNRVYLDPLNRAIYTRKNKTRTFRINGTFRLK